QRRQLTRENAFALRPLCGPATHFHRYNEHRGNPWRSIAMAILDTEVETYRRELPNLLRDTGKFVLIQGDKLYGTWSTFDDVIQEGYRLFGLKPFFVRQISPIEEVFTTTKDIAPCPSSTCR